MIEPKFQLGERVKAVAFTNCFKKFCPEVTGLVVTRVQLVTGQMIEPYYRIEATHPDRYAQTRSVEGAERFFEKEKTEWQG